MSQRFEIDGDCTVGSMEKAKNMSKKFVELSEEEASMLCYEDTVTKLDSDDILYRVILASPWTSDGGKYSKMEVIFQKEGSPEYYKLVASKTGSHYTDWYYEYQLRCYEVTRKEKVEVYYE